MIGLYRKQKNTCNKLRQNQKLIDYSRSGGNIQSVEGTLEALLYHFGVRRIEYPGKKKKFTGRLALQFLIRDNATA